MSEKNQTTNEISPSLNSAPASNNGGVKRLGNGLIISIILISLLSGLLAGAAGTYLVAKNIGLTGKVSSQTSKNIVVNEDSAIVDVVKKASPAVVSIIVSADVSQNQNSAFSNPFFFDPFSQNRPQTPSNSNTPNFQQIAAGSGFFISSDGLILTNKHVTSAAQNAKFSVVTSDGKQYDANVVAQDPINDIALIKIKISNAPTLNFADSNSIEIGQRVIAIGNSLGQYTNTVTTGVVSGIGRNITAGDEQTSEQLEGVIQTDAAINPGNSGGPLLDVGGDVIGMNTAIDQQGQLVGFAIPSDDVQKDLASYQKLGKIVKPFLGVEYIQLNAQIKQQYNLATDNGAWVTNQPNNDGTPAVVPGSAADKAGIKENDIITALNGKKLDQNTTLAGLIKDFDPGQTMDLQVLRNGKTIDLKVTLGQK